MERLLCLLSNMNTGGAETFLMKVYRVIDRERYQMDFCICVPEKCDYEDEILSMGGRIFRIPPKSENAGGFKRRLSEIIGRENYKSVLKITSNAAGFLDLKIAKNAGALRTIARSSNSGDGDSKIQLAVHRLGRLLWSSYVDVKIAPSDLAAEYTFGKKAVDRGEVVFLNNGLDLDVFRFNETDRQRLRAELKAGCDTAVLGHIGRFNTQKNHTFLIRVFEEFVRKTPDSVLVLVGVGDLEDDIRRLVSSKGLGGKVVFTGLRKDIPALLSAFDVFVFPSFYEGMPNTVIEAQACGLPCVIADTITRQADLGGARYLPLGDPSLWSGEIGSALRVGRISADMKAYDIRESAARFCRLCFSGEND